MAFYSRQLKPAETRYTVSEIEYLAAVEAIRHFLIYLDGRRFTLETDHRPGFGVPPVGPTHKKALDTVGSPTAGVGLRHSSQEWCQECERGRGRVVQASLVLL